jgi:hypothetical protein
METDTPTAFGRFTVSDTGTEPDDDQEDDDDDDDDDDEGTEGDGDATQG